MKKKSGGFSSRLLYLLRICPIVDKMFGASVILPITQPFLEILVWKFMCMSILDMQKKKQKKIFSW